MSGCNSHWIGIVIYWAIQPNLITIKTFLIILHIVHSCGVTIRVMPHPFNRWSQVIQCNTSSRKYVCTRDKKSNETKLSPFIYPESKNALPGHCMHKSFYTGLASAEGQKIVFWMDVFRCTANLVNTSCGKVMPVYYLTQAVSCVCWAL